MSAKYFEYYTIILRGAVFSWTHCRCNLVAHTFATVSLLVTAAGALTLIQTLTFQNLTNSSLFYNLSSPQISQKSSHEYLAVETVSH